MNSYEKRIADAVARIAKEKSGKVRTFGQWRPGELISALKAGKLKPVKRDSLQGAGVTTCPFVLFSSPPLFFLVALLVDEP